MNVRKSTTGAINPWVKALSTLFTARGWRDEDDAAISLARVAAQYGGLTHELIRKTLPRSFATRNGTSLGRMADEVASAMATLDVHEAAAGLQNVRILVVSSNPLDAQPLRLDREQRLIREELEKAPLNRAFLIDARPAAPATELARYLLEFRPMILHFAGHGNVDGVAFEDLDGSTKLVAGDALANLLVADAIARNLQLVVLNACYSDRQAQAILRAVPAVVGMRSTIADAEAAEFARSLYMALGQGLTLRQAHAVAVAAMQVVGYRQSDVPILMSSNEAEELVLFPADEGATIA